MIRRVQVEYGWNTRTDAGDARRGVGKESAGGTVQRDVAAFRRVDATVRRQPPPSACHNVDMSQCVN